MKRRLILLIVFLAVPALQRNARNTSRKSDAASVLAAVTEYSTNNGGVVPTFAKWATPTLTLCNVAGCGGTDAQANAKLGYYTGTAAAPAKGDVTIYAAYTAPAAVPVDELLIEEASSCTNATTAAASGNARSFAAVYGVEAGGGYQWQCTGS